MPGQQIGSLRLELDRRGTQVFVQPGLAVPGLARRHVDHAAGGGHGLDQRGGDRPSPTDQDEHARRQRVLHHLDQPRHVGGEQPAGLAHHDHPAVDEEGWGQAGIHDGTDAQLVSGSATDLLDDQRVVAVTHHLVEERADGLGHQGGVVPLDQIDGCRRRPAHSASPMAASTSRARQVPLTSCTRTMRQPHAMPSAAAPMEASRRSVSSKSRILPRKVLFEAESSSG